ncbi:MAG: hypothetical protein LKJ17_11280 [Oscillospiraceae bacterium]|jgi:hypothetical protein|nr:hypothetical protein [Oscillospiraceae bacterium]
MKDILIQILVPILTAIVSFFSATYKSKIDLKKQIQINNTEIKKIKEQYSKEIEKIKIQMDKQSELYEKNAQTDVVKNFFNKMMEDPAGAMSFVNNMTEISNRMDKTNNRNRYKKR